MQPERQSFDFIENKGQWVKEAKYKAEIQGGAIFLTDKGFVYNFASTEDLLRIHDATHEEEHQGIKEELVRHHAYSVNFSGANTDVRYQQVNKKNHYHNYFIGNDSSKWAGQVGLFGKVIQKNVYAGIDVAVYSRERSLKYDFIVSPGADARQIALSYEGVRPVLTREGHLQIKTTVNETIEQAPYSYQVIEGKQVEVKSNFKLKDKTVSFGFPEGYNKNYPLIIDPELIFVTYSGATSDNVFAYATTYDESSNLYTGGEVYSPQWPVTMGAFQTNFNGGRDVGINKYDATGTNLLYSTYYGGNRIELPHAMRVNDRGELVVAGSTNSFNLPTTTNGYSNSLNGFFDMFVVHFNNTGTALIGATYIGGRGTQPEQFTLTSVDYTSSNRSSATSPMELDFDYLGNIWITGNTRSTDFPVTANAFQSINRGQIDGVVFQLDPFCSNLLYSSYLGGSGLDGPASLLINRDSNIVVGGITTSKDFPTTPGAYRTTAPGGSHDGFIAILHPVTGGVVHATYLGTDQLDHVVSLQVDKDNNIYALGRTLGNYPITQGAWHSAPNADCFVDKLDARLSASLMSTRIGNPQTDTPRFFPAAFLVDVCNNVYVTGFSAVGGLPLTTAAYQTTPASFWFCIMTPDFKDLKYGSYFGSRGDHNHIGVNRMDQKGIVYHSICTNGTFTVSASVWAPVKTTRRQDVLSFKFDFESKRLLAAFSLLPSRKDTFCVPATIQFLNRSISHFSTDYVWDFDDGDTSTLYEPAHTFNTPGIYQVKLHAHSDSSCNKDDYDRRTIVVVKTEPPEISLSDTSACEGVRSMDITVHVNNPVHYHTFQWGPPGDILSGANTTTAEVDPSNKTTYYITVNDTLCGHSVNGTVSIQILPTVTTSLAARICAGQIYSFNNRMLRSAGTYSDTFRSASGCDSVIILALTVDTNQLTYLNENICPGNSYSFGGRNLTAAGTYYDSLPIINECSVTILNLSIDPYLTGTLDTAICAGERMVFKGNTYQSSVALSNNIKDTLKTAMGCDSIVSLVLTVLPEVVTTTDTLRNCSAVPFRGNIYTTDTLFTDTLISRFGCDSVYHQSRILMLLNPVAPQSIIDTIGCGSLVFEGNTYYEHTDLRTTFKDRYDCDSIERIVRISIYPMTYDTLHVAICSGESYEFNGISYTGSTTATKVVQGAFTCTQVTLFLEVLPLPDLEIIPEGATQELCMGDELHLRGYGAQTYYWRFDQEKDWKRAGPEKRFSLNTKHNIIWMKGTDEWTCSDSLSVQIDAEACCDLFVPNAFSPNGDGKNDGFRAKSTGHLYEYHMQVFNRYGQKVYSSFNIEEEWDGTYLGDPGDVVVYNYYVTAKCLDGTHIVKKGDVTLVR